MSDEARMEQTLTEHWLLSLTVHCTICGADVGQLCFGTDHEMDSVWRYHSTRYAQAIFPKERP